jgi:ElaB/YqjD/DUF883 family membrane-anchored ribosome-binding protein
MVQATKTASKDTVKTAGDPGLEDLYAMMDVMKNDMQQLAKTIGEVGKAEARRATATAKEKGQHLRDAGEEQVDALRAQVESYGRQVGTSVQDNPLAALGIAAGAGFILGLLMRSRD